MSKQCRSTKESMPGRKKECMDNMLERRMKVSIKRRPEEAQKRRIEKALRTNYVKHYTDNTAESPRVRTKEGKLKSIET